MSHPCRLCSGSRLKTAFESAAGIVLVCEDCEFGTLQDLPTPEDLKTMYVDEYFHDKQTTDFISDSAKKFSFVRQYLRKGEKLLDFGCGTGDFLGIAQRSDLNLELYGYDISDFAAKYVQEHYSLPVVVGELRAGAFPKESFDVIVAFGLFEHVPDFQTLLHVWHGWLKPQGRLFISTPNIKSWDAKLFGKRWYGWTKIPQHVNYFTPNSITRALNEAEFGIKQIKQWGFVRTLDFVAANASQRDSAQALRDPKAQSPLRTLLRTTGLGQQEWFFPMCDMMVVAHKPRTS